MSRVLLIALGVFGGGALLILIGVNLYVQSHGTQARIQQELSQRLGAPLRIQRISVTPWWGLKLTGITIPQSQPGVSPDFLTAKAFRRRIRFSSLFSGHLVIKEVSLVNPAVFWAQNADGKWRVPAAPPEPVRPAQQKPSAAEAPSQSAPPIVVQSEEKSTAFTPEVERVNVMRARFRFLDEKQKSVATFEDVAFRWGFR